MIFSVFRPFIEVKSPSTVCIRNQLEKLSRVICLRASFGDFYFSTKLPHALSVMHVYRENESRYGLSGQALSDSVFPADSEYTLCLAISPR